MSGAGAHRAQAARQQGQQHGPPFEFQVTGPWRPHDAPNAQNAFMRGQSAPGFLGIYDGPGSRRPSEASSQASNRGASSSRGPSQHGGPPSQGPGPSQGVQQNPFGPGLGYDPARSNQPTMISSRLELPAEAYADSSKKYDFQSVLPHRKDTNTDGRPVKVQVNQYRVLAWPQKPIYQYDVHIGNGAEKRGLIRLVWASRAVQAELAKHDQRWLFDGAKLAWCSNKVERGEFRVNVDLDQERGRAPRMRDGRPVDNTIRVVVRSSGQINMAVIKAYIDRTMAFDSTILEAITFLDHCMRQFPSEQYTQIKRSFFSRGSSRFALDNCIEAMKGVYSSMRLCQANASTGGSGLGVNVDVANGTFWIAQSLHQAARNLCGERNRNNSYITFRDLLTPVKDPATGRWTMSKDFKDLRQLHKLRFTVKHRGKENESKIFTIKKFAFDESYGQQGGHAKQVTFEKRDKNAPAGAPGVKITVYDYFRQQYNIQLEHWYLPLVVTERDGSFPMEICTLLPNQRYVFKLGPNQTAAMIKFAVTRPKERTKAVEHGVGMLNWSQDPYLNHYGIKIDPRMTVTDGRLLQNPEVQFGNSKINPGVTGRWDLRGKKFFKANREPLESWGICVLDNCVDQPTMNNFLKTFIQTYTGHGGVVKRRDPVIFYPPKNMDLSNVVTETRKKAGDQSKKEPQILLYVLRDKNSFTYERLKKSMDCRYGIVSQMMNMNHVVRGQPQYCSNVCMKLNAKLGGTTSRVATGPGTKTPKTFFNGPTMMIGADVSHASPGSQQPSMAALTMSFDQDACRYAAAVQTNGYRVEMLSKENIRSMMIPLFKMWIQNVGGGRGPGHIYYFRDGVSEGQYLHVLEQEVKNMKEAIKELNPAANIKFTVIVASKRHHVRFFPKEGDAASDKNSNPVPGVLVERDVTHPFQYDFYLNSHSAIQGTARPVHYHVLLDEANVPVNLLQAMIYQQCYQYMRSTTPVSLHPAVYYAHLASNRARAHENAAASEGPRGGQKFVEKQQDAALKANILGTTPGASVADSGKDRSTEAPPLLALGPALKPGMWYI